MLFVESSLYYLTGLSFPALKAQFWQLYKEGGKQVKKSSFLFNSWKTIISKNPTICLGPTHP